MAAGLEILTSINITRVAQALQDQSTLPQPLMWYDRAAKPQVSDDEIVMREKSYVFAADIISTDARALIRDSGEFTFETTRIAKVKHGFGLNETQMLLLNRIENAQASAADVVTFDGYVGRNVAALILGIKQREESMIIGMLLDGYSYDRLGIKLSGTWGMPAAFKANPAVDWNDPASTPITDIITLRVYAQKTYGETFNRITMSYQALQYIIATTEFRDLLKATTFSWNVPDGAVDAMAVDPNRFQQTIGSMVGLTIETYDGMYREQQSDGTIASPVRFLPENQVLLTNSGDDNGGGWDFAQGIIMETVVGRLGGTSVYGGFPAANFGPVSYATQADPTLNPPGIVIWAVDRGAPRKLRETCSAKITAW